jgi:hypothetical protein
MWPTLVSVAMQCARLKQEPKAARRPVHIEAAGEDRCGHCPACQAFISLGAAGPDGLDACPRCGRAIARVEPLA